MIFIRFEEPLTEGEEILKEMILGQIAMWQHCGPYGVTASPSEKGIEVQVSPPHCGDEDISSSLMDVSHPSQVV